MYQCGGLLLAQTEKYTVIAQMVKALVMRLLRLLWSRLQSSTL